MIPQRLSQQPTAEQIQKQREYLKQQQKLRLMATSASSTHNMVSADTLINNLLEMKDTFKLSDSLATSTLSMTRTGVAAETFKTPVGGNQNAAVEWLTPTSPNFPDIYRRVWSLVGQPNGLVDTGKVFPLLLTSGLPTDVLGYIWGLVNQSVAGQLTEQELYSLLALVALAQRGYSFNSANVLGLVSQPPLPNLNLGDNTQQAEKMHREELNLQPHVAPVTQSSIPHLFPVKPLATSVAQSDASALEFDDFDDFAEFQSATSISPEPTRALSLGTSFQETDASQIHTASFQSAKLPPVTSTASSSSNLSIDLVTSVVQEPVFVQKFPTVTVIGSGRSIGSRLANHSLGAPKTSKLKHHKHHHHHHHRNVPPTSLTIADDDFSDFQQASSDEVFSKCAIKPPPPHTYLLKESAIRTEVPTENNSGENVPLKTFQKSTELFSNFTSSEPDSLTKVVPKPEKGSELMGVEEDRYGALRALSFFSDTSVSSASADNISDHFFSTPITTADDSFADISTRRNPTQGTDVASNIPWASVVNATESIEFTVDDWGAFESAPDTAPNLNQTIPTQDINHLGGTSLLMDELSNQLTDTKLEYNIPIVPLQSCHGLYREFGNIPPLNVISSSQVPSDLQPVASNITAKSAHNDEDDFGDFVGPDAWLDKGEQVNGSLWKEDEKNLNTQTGDHLFLGDAKTIDDQLWSEDVGRKINKSVVLDNHLVSNLWLEESKGLDTQSVSSLELPGLEQAWDTLAEWRKCLKSCIPVFQFAVNTFSSIEEPSDLQEVLESSRGQSYLRDLVEVWSVCDRIATSYQQIGADHKLDPLLRSVESVWESLKTYYARAEIPLESTVMLEGEDTCCICLATGAKLDFEGHSYHAPCANLWLHFVDTVLPALQS